MTKVIRDEIKKYGLKVDHLSKCKEYETLKKLLEEMELFKNTNDEVGEDVLFNYYLGSGYGIYSDKIIESGKDRSDESVITTRRLSIFYLRKSSNLYNSTDDIDPVEQLKILTNYANELDTLGRCLEAMRIYRKVLEINDRFSIARGNYGMALEFFAKIVNVSEHSKKLRCYAYHYIKDALTLPGYGMNKQAVDTFQKKIDEFKSSAFYSVISKLVFNELHEIGDSEEERKYRTWCLNHHLFLNPLNEIMDTGSEFANDPLTIATFTEDTLMADSTEPPRWFAMINQLKEEYIYARYLCFEGSEEYNNVHFADKDVKLSLSSFDGVKYSVRIEQLKSSFRILYSMYDQICFFINDFWKVGLPEKKADAYNVYNADNYPKNNIVLTSLYWVISEFHDIYGEAQAPPERDLKVLRNAFEHKFVKVHEYQRNKKLQLENDGFYHISDEELKSRTLKLLHLSREALMYLVYAVGIEERNKKKPCKTACIHLTDFPDEWKK